MTTRIFLVDDHEIVRRGVADLLDREPDLEVVGEAGDASHALGRIAAPLRIEAHLAPEDPRRSDLERRTLSKLRRVMPDLDVTYVAESTTGLFEQAREDYGEIRYSLEDRTAMSRATTVEGVLDTIYDLAGVAPDEGDDDGFRGHPLQADPHGAAPLFYMAWPATVAAAALAHARRHS